MFAYGDSEFHERLLAVEAKNEKAAKKIKAKKTVYISGLPPSTFLGGRGGDELMKLTSQYVPDATAVSWKILTDYLDTFGTVCGLIQYTSEDDAAKVVKYLHKFQLPPEMGRDGTMVTPSPLSVYAAWNEGPGSFPEWSKLFIKNLPKDLTRQTVEDAFEPYADGELVMVSNYPMRGEASIQFSSSEAAKRTMATVQSLSVQSLFPNAVAPSYFTIQLGNPLSQINLTQQQYVPLPPYQAPAAPTRTIESKKAPLKRPKEESDEIEMRMDTPYIDSEIEGFLTDGFLPGNIAEILCQPKDNSSPPFKRKGIVREAATAPYMRPQAKDSYAWIEWDDRKGMGLEPFPLDGSDVTKHCQAVKYFEIDCIKPKDKSKKSTRS